MIAHGSGQDGDGEPHVREVASGAGCFRPVAYRAGVAAERQALQALAAADPDLELIDRLPAQIAALLRCRNPGAAPDDRALADLAEALLEGAPLPAWGTWFHLPWRRQVVRVLPREPFRELRSDRNRHKIDADEQRRLRALRVGVVGLSVGQAIAVCMAQEGVGGAFRLADYDRLELSNLNRLRAGIGDLGVEKTVLAARAILEMDPYLEVESFPNGVRSADIDRFLLGDDGSAPVDLLVEECDDLALKILLRQRARALRIPVLMATSERGLLDVERFDLEPERPLFHGLVEGLDLAAVAAGDDDARVAFIMRIAGLEALSARGAASLIELGQTVSTWPQLASAVVLGAAAVTDAARRIALGQLQASGRWMVDFDALIDDGTALRRHLTPSPGGGAAGPDESGGAAGSSGEEAARGGDDVPGWAALVEAARACGEGGPDRALVRTWVGWAIRAPSGGNSQPWRFRWDGETLWCHDDQQRAVPSMDPHRLSASQAMGSALENLSLAARAVGFALQLSPCAPAEAALCRASFARVPAQRDPLLEQVLLRATNRRPGDGSLLGRDEASGLYAAAQVHGGRLRLATAPEELSALGRAFGAMDRLRFLSPTMLREMGEELRWTPQAARATGDGLDVDTLELTAGERAALRLLLHAPAMAEVARLGLGGTLQKPARDATRSSSAVGLLEMPDDTPWHWLLGGRALQRVWLEASRAGLWLHPMATLPFLARLLQRGEADSLSRRQQREVQAALALFESVFEPSGGARVLTFRLFRAPPPSAVALRRPVDAVLDWGRAEEER